MLKFTNPKSTRQFPLLKALRPHQWAKNILVFVPIVLGKQWHVAEAWLAGGAAFVCLSMCASSAYLLNDLRDARADREHPTKRNRSIAAGLVSPRRAAGWAAGLLVAGVGLAALLLPWSAALFLALYVAATLLYTAYFKRKPLIDVLVLSGLYVVRLLLGGAACGIVVSEWTLAFAMFLFLSLAFAKRFCEIQRLAADGARYLEGRGYQADDLNLVETFGVSAGYVSVLVLALYINSPEMSGTYQRSWPLWLICPLLVYWISRVWIWARRGQLADDPVVFALTDRVSLAVGGMVVGLLLLATV